MMPGNHFTLDMTFTWLFRNPYQESYIEGPNITGPSFSPPMHLKKVLSSSTGLRFCLRIGKCSS